MTFTFLPAKASTIEVPFNFGRFYIAEEPIENVENDAATAMGDGPTSPIAVAGILGKKLKT
ncbi:hypothetical protein [Microcoleus sp. herbarium14]|uniref:hypothetical protein n=1 Tax=Microcoleus sp. herbarium14 TaxID=3055439 RepID=UPI002FD28271